MSETVVRMPYSVQATYLANGVWIEKGTFEYYQPAFDFSKQLEKFGTYYAVRISTQNQF